MSRVFVPAAAKPAFPVPNLRELGELARLAILFVLSAIAGASFVIVLGGGVIAFGELIRAGLEML